jgi:glutamine---fructose-6-phosphate transaminase (isomerizing)
MCGIFGIITSAESNYSPDFLNKSLRKLATLSERRGKDSSGLCLYNQLHNKIDIIKGPVEISKLLKNANVSKLINEAFQNSDKAKYAFGHARLVTNGTQLNDDNNQPVIKDGIVGVHNGIVTNVDELWEKYSSLERKLEIDTEVMLSIYRNEISKKGKLHRAISKGTNEVFGTVATAVVFNDLSNFILTTNNGSLYTIINNKDILIFASELSILRSFVKESNIGEIGDYTLNQLKPNSAIDIRLNTFEIKCFDYDEDDDDDSVQINSDVSPISIINILPEKEQLSTVVDLNYIHLNPKADREIGLLQYPIDRIKQLKRCTKCLLTETFPYIRYDDNGVCNYCHNYKTKDLKHNLDDLHNLVEPYRKAGRKPEVLIPFSGGRDSTFVLHTAVKDLGLNAIAYTYDWGMVTDLARRNVARICGKLGIENIIVAADIHWKRENIRKNITAWLKNPELGMIPLFMAGDKFFFYYAHKIKKQLGIDLEIWGVNDLENTNFKTGFAGLKPQFDKERIYSLSLQNKLKLFGFVGRNVIQNPGYINQSILDSLGSFASRYFTPKKDYYHLFDYFRWNEKNIEESIINNYQWEKAADTDSTWRIGDGTASFYNYIYTLIAGFCENDTFRSNQIREGMITREKALELIYEENKPRYNSIKWYLEILGLDYETVIKQINEMPRLYN